MTNQQLVGFLKAQPVGVACAGLCVLIGLGIYYRGDEIPDAEQILEAKMSQGERIDANLKNGVQLTEQLNAVTDYRQKIEARLVRPDELAKNQQYFYKLEADTNTKLIDLRQNQLVVTKPGGKGPALNYVPVSYAVAVRGSYPHLLDFLRRLETGSRYCRVVTASVALAGASDKERASEMTLNLSLELLGQP